MGELLKQFDGKGNNQHSAEGKVVALPTQKEAAQSAGLSEHQIKQAVRVANVPEEKFEAAIEKPKPATVTQQAGSAKPASSAMRMWRSRSGKKTCLLGNFLPNRQEISNT